MFFPSNTGSVGGKFFLFDVRKEKPSRATLENWGQLLFFSASFQQVTLVNLN